MTKKIMNNYIPKNEAYYFGMLKEIQAIVSGKVYEDEVDEFLSDRCSEIDYFLKEEFLDWREEKKSREEDAE